MFNIIYRHFNFLLYFKFIRKCIEKDNIFFHESNYYYHMKYYYHAKAIGWMSRTIKKLVNNHNIRSIHSFFDWDLQSTMNFQLKCTQWKAINAFWHAVTSFPIRFCYTMIWVLLFTFFTIRPATLCKWK